MRVVLAMAADISKVVVFLHFQDDTRRAYFSTPSMTTVGQHYIRLNPYPDNVENMVSS
jgi:hypothetical protein